MSGEAPTPSGPRSARRRPPWRRFLKWLSLGLLLLLVLLAVLIGWVAGTRSGLDFAWSLIAPRLPETIEVAAVEGRLTGPLTVSGIEIDNPSMHVAVERVHLEWRVSDLLSTTVHVEQLAVRGVRYAAKATAPESPPPEEGKPFTLPDAIRLPVQVRIDKVAVDDVSVTPAPDAEPIVLAQARLRDARLVADAWRIESLTAEGPMFDVSLQAEIAPYDRYATQLTLDAALRLPDLAPIQTQLHVNGDLDRLTLTQQVAAPYDVTLDATVTDIALDALAGIGIDATLKLDRTRLSAIRSDLPELAPISTQLHIEGTPRRLAVEQSVAAPYNLQLAATLEALLETPRIDAKLSASGTELASIKQDLPKIGLNTDLHVSGTPKRLDVTLDAEADSKEYGLVTASAGVLYTPQGVTIERLRLQRPGTPMELTANGTVALAAGNAMDLDLQWQALRWPLDGDAAYRSPQGQFQLTGTLQDYRLAGQLEWQVTGQTAGQLQLTGSGDLQSLQLAQLDISGGPGDISANADVTWAPALDVRAHVEGSHINPGAVVPEVPGDFSLVADIRAGQQGKTVTAHVDTLTAEGRLRGQPLQLDAELAYLGDHVNIARFDLDYAQATADIDGRLGWTPDAALDLRWAVHADDLSGLWPTLAGSLQTEGTARGTVSAPSIDAVLAANGIEYGDYGVESVNLDSSVDWSGATRSLVTLDVANAQAAGQTVKSLTLELNGTPASHSLELDLDSSAAQLALALDGALARQAMTWDFTLTALQAAYGELAPWTLAAPASGQVSASAQRVADACLTSGDARLCVSGEHGADGSRAKLRLNDLAFAYAEPFLPDNLTVAGALSGTVDARLPAGGMPAVEVHLDTTAGHIAAEQVNGKRVRVLAFDPAGVDVTLAENGLDATLALPLVDTGSIRAEIGVAAGEGPLTGRPLTGQVSIDVAQLDFVSRLVAEVAAIEGRIGGNMRISGTLAAPRVLGDIALEARRIVLLTPGLELTDVRVAASGHGERIDLDVDAHSGGGRLTVAGGIGFGGAGPTVELAIEGERFQAANTPLVRAWISPDLDVAVTPEAVRVNGTLGVPKARITPRDLPAAGVETVSEDAVIVTGDEGVAEAAARAITADIKVVLDDVRIKGFGLKTGIEGTLQVRQLPGEPVTGAGKLTLVEGSYRAYGQSLDIQSGHIYFSGGPISSPGLELRAARYPADDITVGVEVRGSVKQPKLTLFSDPPMPQAETLSWLLLGRPLEGTTGGQDNLIAKAALALGSGRGNQVLDNIGDALGVDDIGIGSAAGHGASDAAFMVGKYLTPKLYISYGVGIFDSISTLSLRYTLNSHWKLESATSGVATGADIIYSFER